MRKIVLCFLLGLLASYCFAQKQKVSVIELQNGSVLRGVLLDSEEGTVKIQTADMSVFVYQESDIKAITETNQTYKVAGLDNRGPKQGTFRGFVDVGYGISMMFFGGGWDPFMVEGSYGYQLMDWLYLGAGAGFHTSLKYMVRDFGFIAPVFADIRFDILNNSVTPYVDGRIGYQFVKNAPTINGLYINPSIGCRVIAGKLPLNFSLGANLNSPYHSFMMSITFRAGIEF